MPKKKISKLEELEEKVEEPAEVPKDNMKNGEFIIKIDGDIGWDVTADSINKQLEKADGMAVVFEIASPGGSVFEGVEIFNLIRNYEGETLARIVGMAASMASYIPLATNKVLAEDNATFMIHNAWGIVMGDSEEMKAEAEILESINGLLAQEYVNKTGKSEKEVLQMMSDETWLFGSEIKEAGFVDEMITHEDDDKKDKKDKDSTIAEAKEKFKSTLSKIRESRMKSDLEKMKGRLTKNLGGKMKKMSKFIKLSIKEKKSLPDSAFAVVYKEGDKKIRKLPFKDANGEVDVPHLRNALVRIAQGKIKLSPALRAQAMGKLKSIAKKYLKTNKETKSAMVMSRYISKFESDTTDKIGAIIKTLKDKAGNKKPSDEVVFDVKGVSLLIQDLEDIQGVEGAKESGDENKGEEAKAKEEADAKDAEAKAKADEEKKKKEEEDKKKTGKGEETKEGDEEESKFEELLKVCEGYKEQVDSLTSKISKFEKTNSEKDKTIKNLSGEISKFKETTHEKLVKSTAEKISKFKNLPPHRKVELEERYSKMSDSALEELGRITENQMFSKLEEPKEITKPSELLEPAEQEQDFSKMSKEEKLDSLATLQAKQKGFIE